ncbi:MAG: hypothetical protein ISS57_18485 [Anaerolineales bacterium]|nr:hypothetical protein [Anaerolineales bacterium]
MSTQPIRKSKRSPYKDFPIRLLYGVLIALLLAFAGTLGALAGYQDGMQRVASLQPASDVGLVQEQFDLGVQDYEAGRYDLARQRFEYVIALAPDDYPVAWSLLGEILAIQNATATYTSVPPTLTSTPTITITPTRDLSGVDSVYSRARSLLAAGDWNGAIEALVVLRDEELLYRVVEVDDSIFAALRNRGEQKILILGDLEGGIYDLTLAERFGPLDYQASVYRDWARLYLSALGYWEAYPEQAVHYFGQIAAAMPGLRDGSGWSASERYRQSLIHYGDQLAAEKQWCEAQVQYEAALAIRQIEDLSLTLTQAAYICSPPTWTYTPSPAPSGTATITHTPTPGPSPTSTATPTTIPGSTSTDTATLEPTATMLVATDTPSPLPTETDTLISAPTETDTPVPTPTDTPSPVPSETPSPLPTATDTP